MWIKQELKVGDVSLHLDETFVTIEDRSTDKPELSAAILLIPKTRDEANRLSVAFRMASKRLEEIGKGLQ